MNWIDWLASWIFGHHYAVVEFSYKNGYSEKLFSVSVTVSATRKKELLEQRSLKKLVASVFQSPNVKPRLCNGTFDCRVVTYLGRIKR